MVYFLRFKGYGVSPSAAGLFHTSLLQLADDCRRIGKAATRELAPIDGALIIRNFESAGPGFALGIPEHFDGGKFLS